MALSTAVLVGEAKSWLPEVSCLLGSTSGYISPGDIAGSYTARYILLYSQESYILYHL